MISRSHVVRAVTLLLSCVVWTAGQQRREPVRATFERLAKEIVVFGPGEFIYGLRETSRIPTKELAPIKELFKFLESDRRRSSDFLPLLKHKEPKVRTLALVALYNLEDPTVLREIFLLVSDQAATFVSIRPFASSYLGDSKLSDEMIQPQSVGQIATSILNAYLESAGYSYGPLGLHDQPGFKEYWKTHGGRSTAAGWWHVRLARAGHSTSPTPADRYELIKRLRGQIDKLPEPDRTFTLLRLRGEVGIGSDVLVSPEELVVMLKKVGPDSLIDLLKRQIRSDDPDLQPDRNQSAYANMCLFILRNSSALLRSSDAEGLLEQEKLERDFQNNSIVEPLISPWWAIGAAQLNQAEAESILKLAYGRFQTRYDSESQLVLAHALWRLIGEAQAPTVADWIYNELANPTGLESHGLGQILQTQGRDNMILAKALINHPRFDELNWRSLETLSRTMNSWSGKEIVSTQELQAAWSPMGWDFYMRDKTQALGKYPKEMGQLDSSLIRWRQALRDSIR